jgi:membrane protease YdiL (CAAX protease family)
LTPFWLDHLLVVVLAVFFPIRASTFGFRRLTLAPPDRVADMRRSLYLQAMAVQWGLSALTLGIWWWRRRSATALGLEPQSTNQLGWGLVVAGTVAIAFWIFRMRIGRDPAALDRMQERFRHLERMLPHTLRERNLFYLVSLTAGICEELLYRGYLLWYLAHWLDTIPAVAVASLIFGIGHAYQGWKGILTTAVVGAVMAIVYLGSGSLWPAMAIHAIIDMHAGSLAHAALSRGGESAAAAAQGESQPQSP